MAPRDQPVIGAEPKGRRLGRVIPGMNLRPLFAAAVAVGGTLAACSSETQTSADAAGRAAESLRVGLHPECVHIGGDKDFVVDEHGCHGIECPDVGEMWDGGSGTFGCWDTSGRGPATFLAADYHDYDKCRIVTWGEGMWAISTDRNTIARAGWGEDGTGTRMSRARATGQRRRRKLPR